MYPGCNVYHSTTKHTTRAQWTNKGNIEQWPLALSFVEKKLGNLSLKDFRGVFAFSATQRGVKVYPEEVRLDGIVKPPSHR